MFMSFADLWSTCIIGIEHRTDALQGLINLVEYLFEAAHVFIAYLWHLVCRLTGFHFGCVYFASTALLFRVELSEQNVHIIHHSHHLSASLHNLHLPLCIWHTLTFIKSNLHCISRCPFFLHQFMHSLGVTWHDKLARNIKWLCCNADVARFLVLFFSTSIQVQEFKCHEPPPPTPHFSTKLLWCLPQVWKMLKGIVHLKMKITPRFFF